MGSYRVYFPDGSSQIVDDEGMKRLSTMKTPEPLPDFLLNQPIKKETPVITEPTEPIGPAAGSIGSAIVHHGVPMALQMGATALAPEAILARMAAGGAGSLLGYLYQQGIEPLAQGKPTGITGEGALENFALGAGMEGAVKAGGGLLRYLTGKSAAVEAGEKAASLQAGKIRDLLTRGTEKVQAAQAGVNKEILKHAEGALSGVREAEVEQIVKSGLGPTTPIAQPITIESLTAATSPVQKASQQAMMGVFRGLSNKFDAALETYKDLPLQKPQIGTVVTELRKDLKEYGQVVTPSMKSLLEEAAVLGGTVPRDLGKQRLGLMTAGGRTAPLSPDYLARLKPEQFAALMGGKDIAGKVGAQPTTVNQMLGLRSRFVRVLTESKNPVDRRVASSVVEGIDGDLNAVVPPESQAVLNNLRDEWHQARSTFSNAFRSRLFRASSPEQVAEAIYIGAKTGKAMGHRASLLINQMEKEAPEQVPILRQSFAGMIGARPDATAEIEKMDSGVFKALFGGTGFDDPKAWTNALRGQLSMREIFKSPEMTAKWNSAFQTGMSSLGTRVKEAALAQAEQDFKEIPAQGKMLADALASARQEAGMTAMKKPLGGTIQGYIEHRFLWHTVLSMGAFTATHNPLAWELPAMYLASSKGMAAALANPKIGKMYYNMLTSPTVEQMGLWAGRLTAAGLTEGIRSSGE